MPYDGSAWDETTPTNADLANEIDDIARDIKQGVRSRMAQEHVFPSSQASTSAAGFHKFVTFQPQSAAPALVYGTSTQVGAVYIDSSSKALMFEDSAGASFQLALSAKGVTLLGGTATTGAMLFFTSGGTLVGLTGSADGFVLVTHSNTGVPTWTSGGAAIGITTKVTAAVSGDRMERGSNVAVAGSATTAQSFSSNFANTSYSLVLGHSATGVDLVVYTGKLVSGFSIRNISANPVTVDWIAVGT